LVAAVFRLWGLSQNDFGRQYYAAGVRSMMGDWSNFWFNAFDPTGFVSLDKPPIALWLQVLSARLLGFDGFAVLLPQVLLGLVAVLLVFGLTRRYFGSAAGLAAAAMLAATPVAIAVDRSNNLESCLIVLLLGAAWLAIRAADTGRAGLLCISMGLLGLGFNVKMGAAWALAPILVGTFVLAGGRVEFWRRTLYAAMAGIILLATSLAWVIAYDATPPNLRPYVGSTAGNSMVELTLYHNGLARFVLPTGRAGPAAELPDAAGAVESGVSDEPRRLWDDSKPGLGRLFEPVRAGQAGWWLPLAIVGLVMALAAGLAGTGQRIARAQRIAIAVLAGWTILYGALFSWAGGFFHTYYLAALAPPLCALGGIGVMRLLECWRTDVRLRLLVPASLGVTLLWQIHIVVGQVEGRPQGWVLWLVLSVAAALLTSLAILMLPFGRAAEGRSAWGLALAGLGLMALPTTAGLSVVLHRPNVAAPVATFAAYQRPVEARASVIRRRIEAGRRKLLGFLTDNHQGERFWLAVPNAAVAAPLILASGVPVMAIGGYAGTDPIVTAAELERMVRAQELRYVMLGGFQFSRRGEIVQRPLEEWVRAHGKPVDPALWRIQTTNRASSAREWAARPATSSRPRELFDLKQ
jgi:4-amino-4-deoxy-L-arabinose transferase-like glycosyltransferase